METANSKTSANTALIFIIHNSLCIYKKEAKSQQYDNCKSGRISSKSPFLQASYQLKHTGNTAIITRQNTNGHKAAACSV